jgi:hypothetical protein
MYRRDLPAQQLEVAFAGHAAVRRLFLMTNTGTAAYLGITIGRIMPALANTM